MREVTHVATLEVTRALSELHFHSVLKHCSGQCFHLGREWRDSFFLFSS